MPKWGKKSKDKLITVDDKLQLVFNIVIEKIDCSVLFGVRGEEEQNKAFHSGASTKQFPNSKHNINKKLRRFVSKAIDVAPYPLNWGEEGDFKTKARAIGRFYLLAGYVMRVADELEIKIRWGGDWDGDYDVFDQTLDDLVHYEVIED